MSESLLVTKEDFMLFLELFDAKYIHTPTYRDCRLWANITLPCGVDLRFELTTLAVTPTGNFYGRADAWTHVKLHTWMFENFSLTGKGSRGRQARQEAWEMLGYLAKDTFEGFNPEQEW